MTENIDMYQGNTFWKCFQLVEEDEITPVSLVGATVRFCIGTTIIETTNGVDITPDPLDATGYIDVVVSNTLMAALTESEYPVELEVTYASGVVQTVFSGILTLLPSAREAVV